MILSRGCGRGGGQHVRNADGHVAQGFEALGAGILVLGVIWSFILGAMAWRRSGQSAQAYLVVRQAFGGALCFSLETEIEGVAPWRRATISGAGTIRRASASTLRGSGTDDGRI